MERGRLGNKNNYYIALHSASLYARLKMPPPFGNARNWMFSSEYFHPIIHPPLKLGRFDALISYVPIVMLGAPINGILFGATSGIPVITFVLLSSESETPFRHPSHLVPLYVFV